MKKIITILLSLISVSLMSQSLQKDRAHLETMCGDVPLVDYDKANSIDTLFCERFIVNQDQFEPYTRTVFVYDEYGRIVSSEYGYFTVDGFRKSSKELYTYTMFDSISSYMDYYWNDTLNSTGDWDATNMKMYNYYSDQQLQSELWLFNPIGEDEWSNQRLIEYHYSFGKLNQINQSVYSQETNDWRGYTRINYTRIDDMLESVLQYYSSDGTNWRTTYKHSYSYSADQMIKIEQHKNADIWTNNRMHTYDLDSDGNILVDLEQHWSSFDSIWDTIILEQKQYTFDSDGNNTGYLHRSAYFEWFNVDKADYIYANNELVSGIQYKWDWNEEKWYEYIKCSINTTPGILSTNQPELENQISVYPNPVVNDFSLQMPNGLEVKSIKLFDVGGKLYNQFDVLPQRINIEGLTKGFYFVEINLGNQIITKKLVKQ